MSSRQSISNETLARTNSAIEEATESLDLSDAAETTARQLYKQSYDEELYHGRQFEAMLGGIVYLAARITQSARTPKRIADAVESEGDDVKDAARHLQKHLPIEVPPYEPQQFIDEFCEELEVDDGIANLAHEIADVSVEAGYHSGRSPTGFAASSIYAAVQIHGGSITQDDVADVASVTPVTIRNCYSGQLDLYEEAMDETGE